MTNIPHYIQLRPWVSKVALKAARMHEWGKQWSLLLFVVDVINVRSPSPLCLSLVTIRRRARHSVLGRNLMKMKLSPFLCQQETCEMMAEESGDEEQQAPFIFFAPRGHWRHLSSLIMMHFSASWPDPCVKHTSQVHLCLWLFLPEHAHNCGLSSIHRRGFLLLLLISKWVDYIRCAQQAGKDK